MGSAPNKLFYFLTLYRILILAGERPQAAHMLKSWVRIPPAAWIFVCCECRVLSGRGLCDELITRPVESCRLCCVVVCNLETSRMGAPYIYDISRLRVNLHGSVHPKNIPIYIQQDATLHSLLYLETVLRISGGTTTHHQERIQLYLQHLVFVTPLLLPAAIVEELDLFHDSGM